MNLISMFYFYASRLALRAFSYRTCVCRICALSSSKSSARYLATSYRISRGLRVTGLLEDLANLQAA